jgi:hypothetical protein
MPIYPTSFMVFWSALSFARIDVSIIFEPTLTTQRCIDRDIERHGFPSHACQRGLEFFFLCRRQRMRRLDFGGHLAALTRHGFMIGWMIARHRQRAGVAGNHLEEVADQSGNLRLLGQRHDGARLVLGGKTGLLTRRCKSEFESIMA